MVDGMKFVILSKDHILCYIKFIKFKMYMCQGQVVHILYRGMKNL